jgi:hypothetical protein
LAGTGVFSTTSATILSAVSSAASADAVAEHVGREFLHERGA